MTVLSPSMVVLHRCHIYKTLFVPYIINGTLQLKTNNSRLNGACVSNKTGKPLQYFLPFIRYGRPVPLLLIAGLLSDLQTFLKDCAKELRRRVPDSNY